MIQSTLCMIAIPISSVLSGFLFDRIPASVIFALSGILTILPVIFYRKVLLSVKLNDSTNVVADSSN